MSAMLTGEAIWTPTPKQVEFLSCPDYEVLYGGAVGGGKALDVLTPIPTPSGWVKMLDLKPGDSVFDERGQPCSVLAVSDIMTDRPCYRVSFSDGSYIIADEQHLWPTLTAAERAQALRRTPAYRATRRATRKKRGSGKRVDLAARNAERSHQYLDPPAPTARTTLEILQTLKVGKAGALNHSIAVAAPLELPPADLRVDPYILGAWLGDGKTVAGSFTTADAEIAEAFAQRYTVTKQSGQYAYGTIGLATDLRAIGVLGYKHIPDDYLRASKEQRMALLQGLMDTDGHCDARGQCEFTTTSIELAVGLRELVTSLGIKVVLHTGRATLNGRYISDKYRLKFLTDLPAFRLTRKLARQKRDGFRGTHDVRYITAVVPVPTHLVKCIKVSSASHCYLAGKEMIPTHNSDSLLIDLWCLQHGGPQNRNHRAIVFRRSFPELQDLINRAVELFPLFIPGIKYNKVEHVFTTPAGAKFEFGYLSNDQDRFKYRGRAWNAIGFDELTLWATPVCYLYLMTRNRSHDRTLPRVIRSTTNPDGPGQKWVMERWGIEEHGAASRIVTPVEYEIPDGHGGFRMVTRHLARTFIPAKLADNPFLRGTGYRETLMGLPPEEQDALLNGLWRGNRVEGAYYFKELQKARAEGRIGRVHYQPGTPVNTFWDLGFNDYNSIWFHQGIRLENRFIHAYQNSGEALEHYVAYMQTLQKERGYVYGTHYLPHDAMHHSRQTGKTDLQLLRELLPGHSFQVVQRVEHRRIGIQQTRAAMASCYWDETECADGIAALSNYRKRFNNAIGDYTDEPVHDRYSNFSDAFRQFAQGFDGAQIHVQASEPKWKKKLRSHHAAARGRSPMTA